MKLNIDGCRNYIKLRGIKNYAELSKELNLSITVINLLERGQRISYDAVKDIYNKLGEKVVQQIIDMEGETMSGFKSKYISVGDRLF